jgi:anti-sigma factor RsiW
MTPQMPFESNFNSEISPEISPEINSEINPENDRDWENFMLLSAYLDGEVSIQEAKQVESLRRQDPSFERLYQAQCQLRQTLVQMPVPISIDPEILIERVLAKVKIKRKRRNLGLVAAAAIAALFSGTIALINFAPREWSIVEFDNPDDESLVLAMEYPILPPASFSYPTQSNQ